MANFNLSCRLLIHQASKPYQLSIKRQFGGFFSKFWNSSKPAVKPEFDLGQPPASKDWPVKHELLSNICEMLYMEKLDGMSFKAAYIDTKKDLVHKGPTVLMLHGTPGSHRDFLPIVNQLTDNGVRVIGLNFPGFGLTKPALAGEDDTEVFKHTMKEKTEFVSEFLKATNLKKNGFDMLIAQGTATPLAMNLVLQKELCHFKSLALISPMPMEFPRSFGFGFHKKLSYLSNWWDMGKLRPFVSNLIEKECPVIGLRSDNPIEHGHAVRTLASLNLKDIRAYSFTIQPNSAPILSVYSHDDPCMDRDLVEETLDIMGTDEKMTTVLDRKGKVVKEGDSHNAYGRYRKAMAFTEGGHYPQDKYSDEISTELFKIIDSVRSTDST